ncbi:MAG: hypothetical protein LBL57_10120 [Tannerella sp.]|jgi:TonB-dependent SusC/RagA subfamily outer membrane receptor|nr:hypothetical protein [Tannerella sp.]
MKKNSSYPAKTGLSLFVLTLLLWTFAAPESVHAQKKATASRTVTGKRYTITFADGAATSTIKGSAGPPLLIIDGKKSDKKIEELDAGDILTVSALVNEYAIEVYGKEAENGAFEIMTKSGSLRDDVPVTKAIDLIKSENLILTGDPLILVDGEQYDKNLNQIKLKDVANISISKDTALTKQYGEKGKNGVIRITTKKSGPAGDDVPIAKETDETSKPAGDPLIFIDGKQHDREYLARFKAEDIASFFILKDTAGTIQYGEEGKNGIILITTKKSGTEEGDDVSIVKEINGIKSEKLKLTDPLIYIDGEQHDEKYLSRIKPKDIASFSILKDRSATEIYGEKGKNGVILITTRNGKKAE